MKDITLQDFLTDEQIQAAARLKTSRRIEAEVIKPNIVEIDLKLGQANDTMYLAYAVEYLLSQSKQP